MPAIAGATRVPYLILTDTPTGATVIDRAGPRLSAAIHSSIGSIRNETKADAGTIGDVTIAAFDALEISHHTEQFIVEALRAADALAVSLVAELDGRVVGHIAFSPVTLSDGTQNWYGLGPVSVLPTYQRQGIGKALIREGLSRLKAIAAGARIPCLPATLRMRCTAIPRSRERWGAAAG